MTKNIRNTISLRLTSQKKPEEFSGSHGKTKKKLHDLPNDVLQNIADQLPLSDIGSLLRVSKRDNHLAKQSLRTRLHALSVKLPITNAVEKNPRRALFLTSAELIDAYDKNPEFQDHINKISSYTTKSGEEIIGMLHSAIDKYKGDPVFKQFIYEILSPSAQPYYNYYKVLEILLRDERNIQLEDLVDIGLCTPKDVEEIVEKKSFSKTKQNFINEIFLGIFTPKRKIVIKSFFEINDDYIVKGVVGTYCQSEKINMQGVTINIDQEKRDEAQSALQAIFTSNVFQHAHMYKEEQLHPIYWAASLGKKDYVEVLLNAGMPIDEFDGKNKGGGLHGAISKNEISILNYLLDHDSNKLLLYKAITLKDERGQSPLEKIVQSDNPEKSEIFENIINKLSDEQWLDLLKNFRDSHDISILHLAAIYLRSETISILLNKLFSITNHTSLNLHEIITLKDKLGGSLLEKIFQSDNPEIFENIINKLSDEQWIDLLKNFRDSHDRSILHLATIYFNSKTTSILFNKLFTIMNHASLNLHEIITTKDKRGESLLERIAKSEQIAQSNYSEKSEIFENIINKLSDEQWIDLLKNFRDSHDRSILHLAAIYLRSETISILLSKLFTITNHASLHLYEIITLKNKWGESLLEQIVQSYNPEKRKIFENIINKLSDEQWIDLLKNFRDSNNRSILHLATIYFKSKTTSILFNKLFTITNHASLNLHEIITTKDKQGESLLERIARLHNSEIFENIINKLSDEQWIDLLKNFRDSNNGNILHLAATYLRSETISILLSKVFTITNHASLHFHEIITLKDKFGRSILKEIDQSKYSEKSEVFENIINKLSDEQWIDLLKNFRDSLSPPGSRNLSYDISIELSRIYTEFSLALSKKESVLTKLSGDHLAEIGHRNTNFALALLEKESVLTKLSGDHLEDIGGSRSNKDFALALLKKESALTKLSSKHLINIAIFHEDFALALLKKESALTKLSGDHLADIGGRRSLKDFALALLEKESALTKLSGNDLADIGRSHKDFALALLEKKSAFTKLKPKHLDAIGRSHTDFALALKEKKAPKKWSIFNLLNPSKSHKK